jgi:integrase
VIGVKDSEKIFKVEGWNSEIPAVDNVLKHYQRKTKSEKTKFNVLQILKQFTEFAGKPFEEIVKLEPKEVSKLVQGFIDKKANEGRSVRYVNSMLDYLKTAFEVNGFKKDRELEVTRYHQPARYMKKKQYIPTTEEIMAMANNAGSLAKRAIILGLYTSGLRLSTFRAIRYRDVKNEIENRQDIITIPVYPEMKELVPDACKNLIPYVTFLSKEATDALRVYLDERIRLYGSIPDEAPLYILAKGSLVKTVRNTAPIRANSIQKIVKEAARRAGIERWLDVYPHCLRKAFERAVRNSGLDPKDQEFLMGHILPGSQDTYYDKTKIDELRNKYAKIEFFPQRFQTEELRKKQIIDTAKLLGYPEDRIKRIEEALAKYKTVDEAMNEIRKLSLESYKVREGAVNSDPKKVIKEDELEHYLAEGWDVHTVLPSGRILIRRLDR